jgi:hypothetical protein
MLDNSWTFLETELYTDKIPPLGLFKRQAGALSLRIQAARHPKMRDLYVFHFN